MHRFAVIFLPLLLVLAACTDWDRENPPDQGRADVSRPNEVAQRLRDRYRATRNVVADLRIYVKPAEGQGSSLTFNLNAWTDNTGKIRILVDKANVPFLNAMIQPDGGFRAVLLRDRKVVRGTVGAVDRALSGTGASGGAFFANIRTIAEDAKFGPVPNRRDFRGGHAGRDTFISCNLDGTHRARLILNRAGTQVIRKDIIDRLKEPLVSISYSREATYDRHLTRPSRSQLKVRGDATEYHLRYKEIDDVPSIDPADLRVVTPNDYDVISVEQFVRMLVG